MKNAVTGPTSRAALWCMGAVVGLIQLSGGDIVKGLGEAADVWPPNGGAVPLIVEAVERCDDQVQIQRALGKAQKITE